MGVRDGVFWGCAALLGYTWLGYAAALALLARLRSTRDEAGRGSVGAPRVTLLITVHNEEAVIRDKILNTLALHYPREQLEILVASDGSTDRTVEIVRSMHGDGVALFASEVQQGKSATQNAALREATGQIIVFTDADTRLDRAFLREIVRPFDDPTVGAAGALLRWTNTDQSAISGSGGLYWHYEMRLWRWESDLGVLSWCPGPAMAVRKDLFRPIEPAHGEDSFVPLDVIDQGYRVVFVPGALADEARISDARAELKARTRMTLRSLSGTLSKPRLLNPLTHPGYAWAIVSHKVLRWLTPYMLLGMLGANATLLSVPWFRITALAQAGFYALAALGWLSMSGRSRVEFRPASFAFSFLIANTGFLLGTLKWVFRRKQAIYQSVG